jgi:predicted MPP superfamily phosphohydrolase
MFIVLLPCLIVALLHLYLWRRLIHDTHLLPGLSRGATLVLALLGASIPSGFAFWWFVTHSAPQKLAIVAFFWLGLMFYLVTILVAWDALRSAWRIASRLYSRFQPPPSAAEPGAAVAPVAELPREARRVFVARMVAGTALVASGGIGAFGVRSALWEITMPEIPVKLARLPKALDGYTIALLTDVHIGHLLDGRFLRQLAEMTNRARPDLIAIGGDLVDGRVEHIGSQVAELRRLRARDGVCFVTGNHEYYSGAGPWIDFLGKLGMRVLMNQRVSLGDAAASGAQFDLAGIPDHRASGLGNQIAPDARAATRGRDDARELVMLAHQPVQIADTSRVGAGLQLSGHTHGGQIYPFGAVALIHQPYLAGLHLHEPSGTQVYVSRGAGFWGPPLRVLAPAEIALIRLHA